CTLGPVLNHAQLLVDMCRVYGVTNLASGEALKGMSFEYACDNVTIGVLPGNSNPAVAGLASEPTSVACLIGSVRERKSAKMDEWMYELQEGESLSLTKTGNSFVDTTTALSHALEKLMEGDGQRAGVLLSTVSPLGEASRTEGLLSARVEHVKQLIGLRQRGQSFPYVGQGLLI
ncbi:Hypothetical protein, putative, partial [Bodo saltans]